MVDVIALVVAICAFIVSVAVPIFEFFWNRKLNRHNLQAEYFREIFGQLLYEDVPIAMNYIHFDGQAISGTDNILDVLRKIRSRSIYFKYADNEFYLKLIEEVQSLENYIVQTPDAMSAPEFADFYKNIHEKIENIYKYMSDEYIGNKM